MLNRNDRTRTSLLWFAIAIIGFGFYNVSTQNEIFIQVYAQENDDSNEWTVLFAQIVPIVGGLVYIATNFLRKQGIKISAEAEEYFVNVARSFVDNQSRMLYKQIRDNPQYRQELWQGKIPKQLGQEALKNVKEQLRTELRSDEFTRATKDMLESNLESIIEIHVTNQKKETAQRAYNMLKDFVPIAVDAALLAVQDPKEVKERRNAIVAEAVETAKKKLESEETLFPLEIVEAMIKGYLHRKTVAGGVDKTES